MPTPNHLSNIEKEQAQTLVELGFQLSKDSEAIERLKQEIERIKQVIDILKAIKCDRSEF